MVTAQLRAEIADAAAVSAHTFRNSRLFIESFRSIPESPALQIISGFLLFFATG